MSATRIVLNGRELEVRADENILDVCLRSGEQIPFSCRGGVCHACLLQCTEGTVPPAAQRGLAPALQAKGYLLACQCQPEGPMSLAAPNPADQLTDCMLHEARIENGYLFLCFESARELPGKAGQFFLLQQPSGIELRLEITGGEPQACLFETLTPCPDPASLPAWLRGNVFGQDFQVAGPLSPPPPEGKERALPPTDPGLWAELEDGLRVRAILEDFYRQVYVDARLAPFFVGNTMDRAIDKQYSFLRQLMTGESCYFGDRPRNAHHWMVIDDDLYDYRQALMHRTQQAHGLSPCQMARWAHLENHFRADMVKDKPWPRRIGDMEIPLEGFAEETLSEGSLCDYCQAEVPAGVTVRYHVRLGKIACPACSGVGTDVPQTA